MPPVLKCGTVEVTSCSKDHKNWTVLLDNSYLNEPDVTIYVSLVKVGASVRVVLTAWVSFSITVRLAGFEQVLVATELDTIAHLWLATFTGSSLDGDPCDVILLVDLLGILSFIFPTS